MNKLIIVLVTFFISITAFTQNYFQLSFKNLNGGTESVNSYAGKKTLYIILPINQNDSVFNQLQAFKDRYHDTVRVVGILSIEDGFQASLANNIQSMYGSMGIIISEGMNTKKASGANQSALMKWLTDKTQNSHFDIDAGGVGHKF